MTDSDSAHDVLEPEQPGEDAAVTVFITDFEHGDREVRLEAGEDFTTSSDGPVSIHVEAHPQDDDDD